MNGTVVKEDYIIWARNVFVALCLIVGQFLSERLSQMFFYLDYFSKAF